VLLNARPIVTAGFANDVDAVNQYAATMYADTASGATAARVRPTAGPIGFPRLHGSDDATAFCEELVAAEGVLLLPGAVYDETAHVRVGFGRAAMPEALERLDRFIATRS